MAVTVQPSTSHAFGILRFLYDGIANQLGLDRGPIPKALPKNHPSKFDKNGQRIPPDIYNQRIHVQAEGF